MDFVSPALSIGDTIFMDDVSSTYLLPCFLGVYAAYYFFTARSMPKIYSQESKIVEFFTKHMPFATEVYAPCFWGFTGRVQTVLAQLVQWTCMPIYEDEKLSLSDGGEIHLSWKEPVVCDDSMPIIVILPGLTGCSCTQYVSLVVKTISSLGYRCVVSNNRGTCTHTLKTPKTYCASHTNDLSAVVSHVQDRFPKAPIAAVGISLGALILYNYVASFGKSKIEDAEKPDCPLKAAMCICMPWLLTETSDTLEKGVDWLIFNYPLTATLRNMVEKNQQILATKYDVQQILKSRSVKEFDQHLTIKMFGYDSIEDYYNHASPAMKLDNIPIPVICLNAADDPFVPLTSIPLKKISESKNVVCVLMKRGGHIGFIDGLLKTGPNLMNRAVHQFASAVFEYPDDLAAALA